MEASRPDLEALQLALKMERDGRQFFLDASSRASHPLTKETFDSLAAWELEHIRIIERFHDSLRDTGQWASVAPLQSKKGAAIETFKTVFQKAREEIDETVKAETSDLEAYRMARDMEDKLSVFYKKQAGESADDNAQLFYTFMADQEQEHYRILDNGLQFLENPAQWFEREEWLF